MLYNIFARYYKQKRVKISLLTLFSEPNTNPKSEKNGIIFI